MDGRAAPITSQTPLETISAIWSGSVRRETPTIGLAVASRTCFVHSSCQPCSKNREAPESFDHSVAEPTATSQRSTRWSARRTNSSPSSSSTPYGLSAATEIRVATVHSPSTASRVNSSSSSQKRARFSSEPPYSSVRRL